jgi:hypothetical protein
MSPSPESTLTQSGVRRFAGLPEAGLPESVAREAGRRLATHPLLTARSAKGDEVIPDALRDSHYLLSGIGVQFDVLRTREGCAVVRATPIQDVSPSASCELVQGLLETVTASAAGLRGTLVETTCAARGSAACLFTLMWDGTPATVPAPEMTPPPATPRVPEAPAPTVQSPVPTLQATAPAAAPSSAYRYLGQVVPSAAPIPLTPTPPAERPSPVVSPVTQRPPAVPVNAPAPVTPPPGPPAPTTPAPAATPMAAAPPAPAAPVAPVAPAVPAPVATAETRPFLNLGLSASALNTRRKMPIWLLRRSWLLALVVLAGTAGGFLAAKSSSTTYSATATLVVQSGAGRAGPGSANDAQALATTYAALIPKDQAIVRDVAASLHTTAASVEAHLSVSVEMGTSLLLVKYAAPTSSAAVSGSTLLARTVASAAPPTAAIASGSVVVVQLPTGATAGGALHKYGAPIGGLFGLLLGIVLVLAAERADPRVDDSFTLGTAAGCPAALVPGDLTLSELARALVQSAPGATVTVVPLTDADGNQSLGLARRLAPTLPAMCPGSTVAVSNSFASGAVELSRGSGPTVLALRAGRPRREVAAAAERLRLMGRAPVWAVLVGKRTDQDAWTHDR